ncbi:MAG: trigger factor, partial [candidate division Zixibacteria bacterium]|nr:trigger factor [candidate division Zixibacteria bacterium]
ALDLGSSPSPGGGSSPPFRILFILLEDRVKIEVVEKDGLKRELNIEIPADVVDTAYEKIYNQLSKNAKIPGFRPGKIPMNVVRKKFKPEATAEIVDELVNKHYHEAIKEKKLEPVGTPVLSKVDIDEGKAMTFTLGIEVMPVIEDIKYDGLKIEKQDHTIEDKDVDEVVEMMRKQQASLSSVDREAKEADMLICDLEPIGGAVDALNSDVPLVNQEIDLDGPNTVKEFKDALIGAKRDEVKEVVLSYPEDFTDRKFAGKSITFKTTVKEVKERVLPELNDGFAKLTGMAETYLEFKIKLREQMAKEKEAEGARKTKKEIVDQMIEKNSFDVPDAMVETYLKNVVEDNKQQNEKADEKEIREKYRPMGIETVRWYLIYHRLATQEKIEVSSQDTEKWIKRFADNYRMEMDKAKEILAQTGKASEIKDGLLEEKVLDFLTQKTGK